MNRVLLVSAASLAAAFAATPASAEHWSDRGFPAAASVTVHRGGGAFIDGGFRHHDRDRHDRRDRDGRRDRRDFDRDDFFGPWDYAYNFDGNRSFDPDKWNDWWHERPWRAYPRWVQHNRECDPERMWQGGGVWRCSW
jgi:hypothetical protein